MWGSLVIGLLARLLARRVGFDAPPGTCPPVVAVGQKAKIAQIYRDHEGFLAG